MSEAVTLVEETTVTTTVIETESTEKTTVETTAEEKPIEEDPGHKVFVGNLSFQTTEPELTEFFANVGKVIKANIITRGSRSLGYGFVSLETEEDAQKVVSQLNRSELGGRQINVEVAKPKSENAVNPESQGTRRGRGGRFGFRGRGRGGRGRFGRGRGGRGRGWSRRRFSGRSGEDGGETNAENNQTANSGTPAANGTQDAPNGKPPRDFRRRGRGRGRGRGNRGRLISRRRSTNSNQAAGAAKTGEPSKTIVFVANLPFSIDDDGLKDIFKDYNVASAHVVRRRGGRSKGFGFVELANEEEQKKALEGLKGVKSQERELVIKVALSDQHVQSGDDEKATGTIDSAPQSEETKEGVQIA